MKLYRQLFETTQDPNDAKDLWGHSEENKKFYDTGSQDKPITAEEFSKIYFMRLLKQNHDKPIPIDSWYKDKYNNLIRIGASQRKDFVVVYAPNGYTYKKVGTGRHNGQDTQVSEYSSPEMSMNTLIRSWTERDGQVSYIERTKVNVDGETVPVDVTYHQSADVFYADAGSDDPKVAEKAETEVAEKYNKRGTTGLDKPFQARVDWQDARKSDYEDMEESAISTSPKVLGRTFRK